jgi:hypothetical protein
MVHHWRLLEGRCGSGRQRIRAQRFGIHPLEGMTLFPKAPEQVRT